METKGPHKDTPELRDGAFRWMNRWLKGTMAEISDPERPRFTPQQLRVFDRLPEDQINTTIHESFLKPARLELPRTPEVAREWWQGKAPELMAALKERSFRGWPSNPPALGVKPAEDVKHDGLRLRAFDFVCEEAVPLRLWLLTAEKTEKTTLVVLNVLDEPGWKEWCTDLGPQFAKALQVTGELKRDDAKFEQNKRALEKFGWAFAAVAPRGVGPTRWSEQDPFDPKRPAAHQIRR